MSNYDASKEVQSLILGAVPERKEEFLNLWTKHSVIPRMIEDNGYFNLNVGAFSIIQFEHKSMAQIWLFAYIVQLFFKEIIVGNSIEQVYKRNEQLLSKLSTLFGCRSIEDFSWPKEIPEPSYEFKKDHNDYDQMMAFDLCCMAGAFFFLHEISHLKIRYEQTTLSEHDEEFECDKFAVDFMLSEVLNYTQSENYDVLQTSLVKQKRAMGIVLGLAFILKTTAVKNWYGTKSHPSVIGRVRNVLDNLNFSEDQKEFWTYFYCIFSAIVTRIPLKIEHAGVAENIKSLSLSLIDNIDTYAKEQACIDE